MRLAHALVWLVSAMPWPTLDVLAVDVVIIDGKAYTEVDLTGYTKAETEEAFLAEVAKLSDQRFDAVVDAWQFPGGTTPEQGQEGTAVSRAEARKTAAAKLCAEQYALQLASAVHFAILNKALDRLVEAHGIPLSEYVDIGAVERCMARCLECRQYIHQHRTEGEHATDAIYSEARTRYGYNGDRDTTVPVLDIE
jgi:hypothetical protein